MTHTELNPYALLEQGFSFEEVRQAMISSALLASESEPETVRSPEVVTVPPPSAPTLPCAPVESWPVPLVTIKARAA